MGIKWNRRRLTQDRAETATEVFTTQKLGSKQSKTPEGFLLCEDVPIARVGDMIYGRHETPIEVGKDGRAVVTRDAMALFSKSAVSSYQGKPVVNDHPDVDVNPSNWKTFAVGICMNPRRGVGDDSDVMLADLLITDAETIRDVQAGKREVSAGYEADYEQTGEGRGRQTNIIGNHVALVERGRCGPRCAIGDHHPTSLKENSMKQKTRRIVSDAVKEAVRRSFKDAEEAALEQLGNSGIPDGDEPGEEPDGDETDGNHTHIHIHSGEAGAAAPAGAPAAADGGAPAGGAPAGGGSVEDRLTALEGQMGQILAILQGGDEGGEQPPAEGEQPPAGDDVTQDELGNTGSVKLPDSGDSGEAGDMSNVKTGDRKATNDSAGLETSFRQLLSDAEILLPGYRMPTFDAKTTRQKTVDNMCSLRKQILGSICLTADGKALVDGVAGAPVDLSKQDCAQTAVLFRAAAGAKKLLNNRTSVGDAAHRIPTPSGAPSPSTSLSALNAQNKAFWASQGKK